MQTIGKFDTEEAIRLYKESFIGKSHPVSSIFEDSLRLVLNKAQNDKNITNVIRLAYLLGTAAIESGYSLQRWEADFVCGPKGIPYGPKGPCQSALNYYRSTKGGKLNYYTLGLDSRGFPYFGRGLIQLTGKENYERYGTGVKNGKPIKDYTNFIGVNLADNPELALTNDNSYAIAIAYMIERKTFQFAEQNNFAAARKSVKGNSEGFEAVRDVSLAWKKIIEDLIKKYRETPNWYGEELRPITASVTIINSETNEFIKKPKIEPLLTINEITPITSKDPRKENLYTDGEIELAYSLNPPTVGNYQIPYTGYYHINNPKDPGVPYTGRTWYSIQSDTTTTSTGNIITNLSQLPITESEKLYLIDESFLPSGAKLLQKQLLKEMERGYPSMKNF